MFTSTPVFLPVVPLSTMLCTGPIIIPSLSVAVKDSPRLGNKEEQGLGGLAVYFRFRPLKVSLPEGLFPAPMPAG